MTPHDRQRMLNTLRQALGSALLPGASLSHPGAPPLAPVAEGTDLVTPFRTQLTALGGVVHEPADLDGMVRIITTLIGAAAPRALIWSDDALPVKGLREALVAAGVEAITQGPDDVATLPARERLASCTVGITGASAGLAQTGSVVVVSGPGKGRLASLLPPIHVAFVHRESIVASLPDLIAVDPELVTSGANFVVITGPSRTADIEHTLSRGVHGPKEVHVLLV